MKKIICTLKIFYSLSIFSQNINFNECEKFKTGVFVYEDINYENVIVTRTKKKQIEKDLKTGLIIVYSINWISDCHYTLVQISSNDSELNKANNSMIDVIITTIDRRKYRYEAKYNGIISSFTMILK